MSFLLSMGGEGCVFQHTMLQWRCVSQLAVGQGGILTGGVCQWGVSASGECLPVGGVCQWGVSASGGCLPAGGVCPGF